MKHMGKLRDIRPEQHLSWVLAYMRIGVGAWVQHDSPAAMYMHMCMQTYGLACS